MSDETQIPNTNRFEIRERLQTARQLAGLSQGQAAKLMGMHRPTISEIEAGRRKVSADELKRFADVYSVGIAWLSGGESQREQDPRVQMAAREIAKLRPDDIDRVVALLNVLRKSEGDM